MSLSHCLGLLMVGVFLCGSNRSSVRRNFPAVGRRWRRNRLAELCSKPGYDPRRANVPIGTLGTLGTYVVDGTSLLPGVLPMRFVSDVSLVSLVSDVSVVSLGERVHPKGRCSG